MILDSLWRYFAGDTHREWAASQATEFPPPWLTCEATLSEAFHLPGPTGVPALSALLRRDALRVPLGLSGNLEPILRLLKKYADVPISLADACLVRISETLTDPVVLTIDADFRICRRHGRQVVPHVLPG